MKLIIDIHEKDYQTLKKGHIPFSIQDALMKGITLPKGHGRIIDESKINTVYTHTETNINNDIKCIRTKITHTDAPTIIEGSGAE